ncbi:Formyltransferase [Tothia fuscella]|uniref:methionyl-tRNA formyltransferase n=1 Tax=Tothia fuscella TaxID=1048955 RepID=A0A9P4TTS8_9PEZI|nr:Formyltransferase [Tothia fuscella]
MNFLPSLRSCIFRNPYLPICKRNISTTGRKTDSLRILFCGSDDFSIASLEALEHDRQTNAATKVESVDVLSLHGKPHGRGLKKIRDVPIIKAAEKLDFPIHNIDHFTRQWQLPPHINLIIAVSFGLLIPPRILLAAKYGGLNVHPSMLPDLRGPAPIHHALLLKRPFTGVTLQTLHPSKFDHGDILAQTPFPGLPVLPSTRYKELHDTLAGIGAKLLVDAINTSVYDFPRRPMKISEEQMKRITAGKGTSHAPKITPEEQEINWAIMSTEEILHRQRVIGPLWDNTIYAALAEDSSHSRRVKYTHGFHDDPSVVRQFMDIGKARNLGLQPGDPLIFTYQRPETGHTEDYIGVKTINGAAIIRGCTLAGGEKDRGVLEMLEMKKKCGPVDE